MCASLLSPVYICVVNPIIKKRGVDMSLGGLPPPPYKNMFVPVPSNDLDFHCHVSRGHF